jgi:hypothetical protein
VVRLLATERDVTKAKQEQPIAVAALKRKRAEIAGVIADLEKQVAERRADLLHIDHALRLFDPTVQVWDIRGTKPRVRNTGYFAHGELSRRIYDALREHESVSAAEVAAIAIRDKKLGDDKRIRATFVSRFLVRLDQMAAKGTVERIGSGNGVRWKRASDL